MNPIRLKKVIARPYVHQGACEISSNVESDVPRALDLDVT